MNAMKKKYVQVQQNRYHFLLYVKSGDRKHLEIIRRQ